jgi:hypothetical protein
MWSHEGGAGPTAWRLNAVLVVEHRQKPQEAQAVAAHNGELFGCFRVCLFFVSGRCTLGLLSAWPFLLTDAPHGVLCVRWRFHACAPISP